MAFAAPVLDGMMLTAAARARRKILVRKIENALVVRVTVDRAHESVLHAKFVVHHLGQRGETVGRATRVGNNRVLRRVVNVVIDPDANRRVGIFRRRGNQHAFRAGLADVQLGFVAAGEKSGRFQHHIHPQFFPRQIARVALLEDFDLVTAHDDVFIVVADLAVELAMNRVPFEQMRQGMGIGEIVDRANALDLFLCHCAQDIAPDAAEAVNCEVCHK